MSKPRRPISKSETTQNVFAGAAGTGTIAYLLAIAICNLLNIEPTPEVLAAIITALTAIGAPLLSRLIAMIR